MAIRKGKWRCPSCQQENDGPVQQCAHCGLPKPANVRYYLPGDAPEVTDPAEIAEAKSGPKWVCPACGSPNKQSDSTCHYCHRPRSSDAATFPVRDYGPGEVPRSDDDARAVDYQEEQAAFAQPAEPQTPSLVALRDTALDHLHLIGGGILAVLAVVSGVWFFSPRTTQMEVTDFQWSRTVSTEVYQTVQLEDWEGEVPSDARIISHSTEVYTYNTVPCGSHTETRQDCQYVTTGYETYNCGSRDLGNGYFEDIECSRPVQELQCQPVSEQVQDYCQVPEYREKYYYEAERWVHSRDHESQGRGQSPTWPDFTLEPNERESGRFESYSLTLTDGDGREYTLNLDYTDWIGYRLGQVLDVRVNRAGIVQIVEDE